ncbi:MAG: type VI secretion system tube protein Hcp [Azoarcus sp.]|jgi:type VI secretion system secreted protein Hcp|nr:type VI secretion system tube protein Hcp [Azoarcus sp.]
MLQEHFIQLDGITGESKQAKHKGWIDVLSFSYAVSQSSSMFTGGGGGVGKADFPAFTFIHYVDRASPNLFKYCAAGKHIPKAVLSSCKVGDGSQEFMRVIMTDVLIVNAGPSGSTGGQAIETVGLSYSKIEIEIREQKADGSMCPAVSSGWDIKANKECG